MSKLCFNRRKRKGCCGLYKYAVYNSHCGRKSNSNTENSVPARPAPHHATAIMLPEELWCDIKRSTNAPVHIARPTTLYQPNITKKRQTLPPYSIAWEEVIRRGCPSSPRPPPSFNRSIRLIDGKGEKVAGPLSDTIAQYQPNRLSFRVS